MKIDIDRFLMLICFIGFLVALSFKYYASLPWIGIAFWQSVRLTATK